MPASPGPPAARPPARRPRRDGRLAGILDLAFPTLRLGVEAHSRQFHFGRGAEHADEDRDHRLARCGWEVLYVGWQGAATSSRGAGARAGDGGRTGGACSRPRCERTAPLIGAFARAVRGSALTGQVRVEAARAAAAATSSRTDVVVGQAGEGDLVGAGREGHAPSSRAWKNAGVGLLVGRAGGVVVDGGRGAEVQADQRADDGHGDRHVRAARAPPGTRRPAAPPGGPARRRASSSSRSSAARPAAVASGFPDSVPAWYTGPSGASDAITSARPPKAPMGSPPPMTLPKQVRSGRDAVRGLGAAEAEAEAGDHLVEDQQRAGRVARGPQPLEEARRRARRGPCWRRPARRSRRPRRRRASGTTLYGRDDGLADRGRR